jgi:hypothetical protein
MSSHDVTIAAYAVIVATGIVLQALSGRAGSSIPPLGAVLSRVMRTRSGRVGVVAGWAWFGLHFFAR